MLVGGELKEDGIDGTRETHRKFESRHSFLFGIEEGDLLCEI
jgi:hypothetical protein